MTLSILLILIVAVGAALIAVILVQQTQTGGLSAFTGGASGSVFGAKGSTGFLFKLTAVLMISFAVLCVLVANVAGDVEQPNELNLLNGDDTSQQLETIETSTSPSLEKKEETSAVPSLVAPDTSSESSSVPSLEENEETDSKENN